MRSKRALFLLSVCAIFTASACLPTKANQNDLQLGPHFKCAMQQMGYFDDQGKPKNEYREIDLSNPDMTPNVVSSGFYFSQPDGSEKLVVTVLADRPGTYKKGEAYLSNVNFVGPATEAIEFRQNVTQGGRKLSIYSNRNTVTEIVKPNQEPRSVVTTSDVNTDIINELTQRQNLMFDCLGLGG